MFGASAGKLLAKVYLPEAPLLWWEAASCWRRACLASGVSVLLISCWAAQLASSCKIPHFLYERAGRHFANVPQAPFQA